MLLSGVLRSSGCAMLQSGMRIMKCFYPGRLTAWLVLLAGLAAGCAHSPKAADSGSMETFPTPLPPIFLNGPMALLLTNQNGFRAHVAVEGSVSAQPGHLTTGELIGEGGKLLFAPAAAKVSKKQARPEDSAFIWDVAEHRGWVLNEPLQGYAPVSSSRAFTNVTVVAVPAGAASQKISGYLCVPEEATVTAADGVRTTFVVWRAKDLQELPLRIESRASGAPVVLTLSKVHLEAVPGDAFSPPNGFTKYASAETMMTELFLRKHNLSRRQVFPEEEGVPAGPNAVHAPVQHD